MAKNVVLHSRRQAHLYQISVHGWQGGLGGLGNFGEREVEARFAEGLIAVPKCSLQRVSRLLQQRLRLIPTPQACNMPFVMVKVPCMDYRQVRPPSHGTPGSFIRTVLPRKPDFTTFLDSYQRCSNHPSAACKKGYSTGT